MFAMLSATALYGLVGALFAVPIVAIISASIRYLQDTLVFARWRETPISTVVTETQPPSDSSSGRDLQATAKSHFEEGEKEAEAQADGGDDEREPEDPDPEATEASVTGERSDR
jgi:hypothetical protein